jgi:hypothetical protein
MDNGQLTAREAQLAVMTLLDRTFVSLPQQLDNIRRWNEERRWGFSASELESVDLTPAHAEVLAAAAHFPQWIRAMDGKTIPYTWLSGYEVMMGNVRALSVCQR